VPFDITTFPVSDPVAQALGAQPLDAEESTNFSFGAVFRFAALSITIDAYRIDIEDRIVLSENLTQTNVREYLQGLGFIGVGGGRFFINGVDTETEGVDVVINWPWETDGAGTFDFTLAGDRRSYLDLMSETGLKEIAMYADAIGPHKWMVVQFSLAQARDTGLARRARAAGLGIHIWTLRAENEFLPPDLRSAGDAAAWGDLRREIHALLDAGITGMFADQPDLAVRARDEWWGRQ